MRMSLHDKAVKAVYRKFSWKCQKCGKSKYKKVVIFKGPALTAETFLEVVEKSTLFCSDCLTGG
jgi:hypothetical protein